MVLPPFRHQRFIIKMMIITCCGSVLPKKARPLKKPPKNYAASEGKKSCKPSEINARQELERRILHGMSCEWEAALLHLDPAERHFVHRPLFAIKNLKTQWGNWSQVKREISLSRHLVLNYPWDSIRDVLLHEMAHQISQQMPTSLAETSHGSTFKRVCAILGIDPVASRNYKPLQDRMLRNTSNHRDKIMIRIKKLMALAESHNRYEAEAAMLKAHELIAKYNVDQLDDQADKEIISVFMGQPALRHPKEAYFLANLLQDFYFVRGIWVSAYVFSNAKMGRVLEISGTIQNVEIASYIYEVIRQYIDSQWPDYNDARKLRHYRKSDFAVGIIEGFRFKLESHVKRNTATKAEFAMIHRTDPALEQYCRYRYPSTRKINKAISHRNATVLNDGKKIGRRLIIAKGIAEKKKGRIRLIGHK
jgi:predicted SprT family Zn-dependent metalloprotease